MKTNPMNVVSERQACTRIGSQTVNCQGELMRITAYRSATDIDIQFMDTGNKVFHCTYDNFKRGSIKDYFLPTFYEKGVIGGSKTQITSDYTAPAFKYWDGMLKRCYYMPDVVRYPSYTKCAVADEWLYLANFEKWFDENYYQCGEEKMCLDKDILRKGNKVYSAETVIFVPERINCLFTKADRTRGEFPIGVYYKKKIGKYIAQISKLHFCSDGKKRQEHLGVFDTPEDAFAAYKYAKEAYINEVAEWYAYEYQNFPEKLLYALRQYKVEITD